jgi:hypothetical protein
MGRSTGQRILFEEELLLPPIGSVIQGANTTNGGVLGDGKFCDFTTAMRETATLPTTAASHCVGRPSRKA